jgi:hypothetical protein
VNPYLNYHRPCFFPGTRTDHNGKQRKVYRYETMMTLYDKLKSLPDAKDYLKPGGGPTPKGPSDTLQNHSWTDSENRLTETTLSPSLQAHSWIGKY